MTTPRLRVLALVSYLPKPEDRGDPVRVAAILRALAAATDLTVMAVRRPDTKPEDEDALRAELVGSEVLSFAPAFPAAPIRWFLALLLRTPPWVLNRSSLPLWRQVRRTVPQYACTVAIGEAAAFTLLLPGMKKTPWHWDKANVLGASTRLDVLEARAGLPKVRRRLIQALSFSYERRLVRRAATVSVTSEQEADRLHSEYGRSADAVVRSGVEVPKEPSNREDRQHVLWLGSLAYSSNVEGLRRFLDEGLSVLLAAGMRLRVVGSGASSETENLLRAREGVTYEGYVPDVSTVLRSACYAVVPLWSGAGIKLKTLTLMSYGLTVSSTPIGMEGVPDTGACALVGVSGVDLARAIVLTPPAVASALGERARDTVGRHSAPDVSTGTIVSVLEAGPYK